MEALPYEKPRLSVTAMVSGNDFAALLNERSSAAPRSSRLNFAPSPRTTMADDPPPLRLVSDRTALWEWESFPRLAVRPRYARER